LTLDPLLVNYSQDQPPSFIDGVPIFWNRSTTIAANCWGYQNLVLAHILPRDVRAATWARTNPFAADIGRSESGNASYPRDLTASHLFWRETVGVVPEQHWVLRDQLAAIPPYHLIHRWSNASDHDAWVKEGRSMFGLDDHFLEHTGMTVPRHLCEHDQITNGVCVHEIDQKYWSESDNFILFRFWVSEEEMTAHGLAFSTSLMPLPPSTQVSHMGFNATLQTHLVDRLVELARLRNEDMAAVATEGNLITRTLGNVYQRFRKAFSSSSTAQRSNSTSGDWGWSFYLIK
jgi:hypothetical protein